MKRRNDSRRFFISFVTAILCLYFALPVLATTQLSYQYDANGNLIQGDGKFYEYNEANQLVKVRQGDQSGPVIAQYFYDYAGQRVKKVDNGVVTYYIGKHFETQEGGIAPGNTSYYFANGERVAKKDPSGNFIYYHSDHLGSTSVTSDSQGNAIDRINIIHLERLERAEPRGTFIRARRKTR